MSAEPSDHPNPFGKRDAARLVMAAALMVVALAATVAVGIHPSGTTLVAGDRSPSAIVAPRDATIPNPVATEEKRSAAAAAVPFQYDYDPTRAAAIAGAQVTALKKALEPVDTAFGLASTQARRDALGTVLPLLSSINRTVLMGLEPARWPIVEQAAETALGTGESKEIRDTDLANQQPTLALANMPTDQALSASETELAAALASPFFIANSTYSSALTDAARATARAAVPDVQDVVKAGQVLVEAGQIITPSMMVDIKFFGLDLPQTSWSRPLAWLVMAAIAAALLLLWLWRYRAEYWQRARTLGLIGLVFVTAVVGVKIAGDHTWLPYLIPTAAAGMILALLLDAGIGVVVTVLLALLAGLAADSSLEVTAYVALGGLAGLLAIRKGEEQHYVVEAAVAIAVTDIAVVGAFGILGQHDMTGMAELSGAAAAASIVSAVIALGGFALLGNMFGILTHSKLLELANPSHPLLRRLLLETPGTYHHSLMVGNLAERAASAIGADALLVRCAAYYHDIGKLANPAAFIENQAGGENIHTQLEPEVSAKILRQHVPDGVDLANRAHLPRPLVEFIPQHHGTAIMGYVYGKAREAAAAPLGGLSTPAGRAAADKLDRAPYRHRGARPHSREAAILMLADGVEASVRSLSSRDEGTIRAMVSQIIRERVADGQLNECDLTMRDLAAVEEAFVAQLMGMYHQRIAYPANAVVELESRRRRRKA